MRLALLFSRLAVAVVVVGTTFESASAQNVPWDIFYDDVSTSACEVVNAANAELVVLTATGQLTIVSGQDVTLVDTFVDVDGTVYFEGSATGIIDFAEDGDGFRTLWWMTLTGLAVEIDDFTGVPAASAFFPSDYTDVACDACPLWDDQSVCVVPPVTLNFCGRSTQVSLGMTMFGLMFLGFLRRRW